MCCVVDTRAFGCWVSEWLMVGIGLMDK